MEPSNYTAHALPELRSLMQQTKDSKVLMLLQRMARLASEGVKFMLPENGDVIATGQGIKSGLPLRLPYPVCVLEYKGARTTETKDANYDGPRSWDAITIADEGEVNGSEGFFLYSIVRNTDKDSRHHQSYKVWCPLPGCVFLPYDQSPNKVPEGMYPYHFTMGTDFPFWVLGNSSITRQEFFEELIGDGHAAINLCACLACGNVQTATIRPNENLNKKREKKGKLPFFEYKMLVLKPSGPAGPAQGGTHSSPRVHLRRGHIRQYKPGQFTWVSPSVVGNKAKGIILKDYMVGQ